MSASDRQMHDDEPTNHTDTQSSVDAASAPFCWKRGVETPLLVKSNPAAVQLCIHILEGSIDVPSLIVSEAVAVQIYRLVHDPSARADALKGAGMRGVYRILSVLAHGARAQPDAKAVERLRLLLARKASGSQPPGLDGALRFRVGQRRQEQEMAHMSYDEATAHILKQWDLLPLEFDFGVAAGDGGGEPGDGSPAETAPPPQPPRENHVFDPRTKALDSCLGGLAHASRRAAASRGEPSSEWAARGGDLPFDALVLIDTVVRRKQPPHQAKRALTFERQLVQVRQLLDAERQLRAEAQVELVNLALRPQRERRALEAERASASAFRQQAAEAEATMRALHVAELKELRAEHAAERRQLLADARQERVAADEHTTELQGEIVRLRRELRTCSARKTLHAAEAAQAAAKAAQAEAEAEAARVRDQSRA